MKLPDMTTNNANLKFIILDNERLDAFDSRAKTEAFILDRLKFFAPKASVEIVDRSIELETFISNAIVNKYTPLDFIVIVDIMNPIIDFDLVAAMVEGLNRNKSEYCTCEGAIPGSGVERVISVKNVLNGGNKKFQLDDFKNGTVLRWNTQERHNNQFNLYKFKRLKVFLTLIDEIPDLYCKSIDEIIHTLSEPEIFLLLTSFGEKIRTIAYDYCPHCEGTLQSLSNTMSQAFMGYLPQKSPLYFECESCGLVIQNPAIHEDDVHKIYDSWDKQDFVNSHNNPYTNQSIRCDFTKILPLLSAHPRILDLGGGIGNFSKYLASSYSNWDITHSDFEIKSSLSVNGVKSRTLDFTRDGIGSEDYDLITAWEVIEHVPYHRLSFVIENIWKSLSPGGFFIFSTPDFDSPLCKSFDFYALCPPFHYTVFGQKWLENYFEGSEQFEIFDVRHCSDFLDDAVNWYSYGSNTCPSLSLRSTSQVLQKIFELDVDNKLKNELYSQGYGTEIVMTLRKKLLD